jgi:hypothetical protein
MTTHTPGPWKIVYSDGSGPEYITASNQSIATLRWGCSCCKDTPDSFDDMSEEEQANARLIAAAPELLEALEFCYTWLENMRHEFRGKVPMSPHMPRPDMGLSDVAAAIAKARGE